MAKLGVAAAWGVEADEATEIGKEKAAKSAGAGESRASGQSFRARRGGRDVSHIRARRGVASGGGGAPSSALRPSLPAQVFAATQLVGVFHSAPGPAAGSSDPSGG